MRAEYTADTAVFTQDSAWWAFNFVANWASLKYDYIIKDVQEKQNEIELAALESIRQMDKRALAVYKTDP